MGVTGQDNIHRRVLNALHDRHDRPIPRNRRIAIHGILAVGSTLMDQHDLNLDTLLAQFLRLGLDRGDLVQELSSRLWHRR